MLPSMLSTDEATAVAQQHQRLSESPFEKDILSSAPCLPGFPQQTKSSANRSTLSTAEEQLFSSSAGVDSLISEATTGSTHRFSSDREFVKAPHAVNGKTVCDASSPAPELSHHHQEVPAASSTLVSRNPTVVAGSSPASSPVVTDAHTIGAAVVDDSTTSERFFTTCTRDPGSAASPAYTRESTSPPSLKCSGLSPAGSSGEIEKNASEGETERREHAQRPPPPPPPLHASSPTSSPFSDAFQVASTASRPDASPADVRTSNAVEQEREEEVPFSISPGQITETQDRSDDRTKGVHGAAAAVSTHRSVASPSKYVREPRPGGGRSLKGEDALEVIMRVDAAVEALVAHAEDQADQIKSLTTMVEDLSLKLENLQESLFLSGVGVRLTPAPPAPAELPAGAAGGVIDVRQSRGRMIPPPLPRGKATDPSYGGAGQQQRLPFSSRHDNSAAFERSSVSRSTYLATARETENEALERRRVEEQQREAQRREEERIRREEERLRREEEERKRRDELARRAAEEQRRREALDKKRKNIISSLISSKAGSSSLFGDDGGAASHRNLFDD